MNNRRIPCLIPAIDILEVGKKWKDVASEVVLALESRGFLYCTKVGRLNASSVHLKEVLLYCCINYPSIELAVQMKYLLIKLKAHYLLSGCYVHTTLGRH